MTITVCWIVESGDTWGQQSQAGPDVEEVRRWLMISEGVTGPSLFHFGYQCGSSAALFLYFFDPLPSTLF